MPFVQTPDLRLHYQRLGSGPQAIVFLHDSFATGRWWQPTAAGLSAEIYTCYLLDLAGSGASSSPADPASYNIERQAADLAAFVESLDLWAFDLVGHSLGAAIALTYAVRQPSRLRSLALVSAPSPHGTPTPPEGLELLEQMRSNRALLAQALASTMPSRPPDAFFQQLVEDAQRQAPAAFTANALALADWRLSEASLAQLRLPVLLVWGDRDHIVERNVQRQLLLAIPGANNLEVMRGAGHCPMLERSEGFLQVLLDFIGQDFGAFAVIRQAAQ